jgi:hydrogenase large subunit
MAKVVVDPVTRIEGHLKIEVEIEGGVVQDAWTSGTLWRGYERIMQGRDPRDAVQIMQRICGVCPTSHCTSGTLTIDDICGIEPPPNGRIIRNLILGSNFIQSHVLHFFHLAALDYVDVTRVKSINVNIPPFQPRYEAPYNLPDDINEFAAACYLDALVARRQAQEALAIWGGKMPHVQSIVPGGVSEVPDAQKIFEFISRIDELIAFIENKYIPVVMAVAQYFPDDFNLGIGCKNMMAYGGFPLEEGPDHVKKNKFIPSGIYLRGQDLPFDPAQLAEQVKYSWYNDDTGGQTPDKAVIEPNPTKKDAYSWLKAPRYNGSPMEVGPLARMWVMKQKDVRGLGDKAFSVVGRHFARAIECKLVAHELKKWALELQPGQPVCVPHKIPTGSEKVGMGLCEAPRGALGHWQQISSSGRTAVYNCIVPTTVNASPRDERGVQGPMEQALIGSTVRDVNNPVELVKIVRSFDPCFGCAIHVMTPDQKTISQFAIN